jgi:hypothetical protein
VCLLTIPLFDAPERWHCPNCHVTDVTAPLPPGQSRYHPCAGLHGLSAPLIRDGTRAKVEAHEREDYLNGDQQQRGDDGKVYMNVEVTRDEGTDVTVFAGLAHAEMRS